MALLEDVFDDQKGGSVLAISSDMLAGNKAVPTSAMQPGKKRTIYPLPSRMNRSCNDTTSFTALQLGAGTSIPCFD
jgi:hypothetical protein